MADTPSQGAGGTNWKGMLKDKKLWIGAGVAGVLGLAVFLKRGGSSGEDSGPGSGAAGTPLAGAGYVAQGGGDTTGANIASWLSSYSASMEASNTAYQQHLTDTMTALYNGKGGGGLTPDGVYYLENSAQGGKPQWGLMNNGQWLTTGSQNQANSWAAQYMPDKKATYVDQTTWAKLGGTK